MTIVNKKFYDSAFTLPLVTTQSTSAIKLKTVPYPLLCSHETGAAPAPIPHTDLTYVKLVMGLHSWCQEAEGDGEQEEGERIYVAYKIRGCYTLKDSTFGINHASLTSLPAAIGNLSNLTTLGVYCGELTTLPAAIGNLSNLTSLQLTCRVLTSLPAAIGNLSNLTGLYFHFCEFLTSLPAEIGNLSQLKKLELMHCRAFTNLPAAIGNLSNLTSLVLIAPRTLTSLPAAIGNLSNLTTLELRYCESLTSLPNELARLPRECLLNTENSGLDARASIAFQDAITRAHMENPNQGPRRWLNTIHEPRLSDTNTFDETLEQYLTLIDKILELKTKDLSWFRSEEFKNQFSEEDKNLLNQFLKKIKNTADFKEGRTRGGTLSRISYILEACSNSNFKESLFWLIRDALDSCSDRAAITLNRIEVQRQLLSPELASDLKKLSHFLVTCQRLQLVHEEAAKIIEQKNLGDAIEPMLFLQIQLKELLDLPIATEGMLYPAMARITKDEIKEIGLAIIGQSELREQQIEILCTPPQTIYDATGMPIKIGNISPTNPFLLNIPEFWEKALTSKYPKEFQKIEPPFKTKNLHQYFTPEELLEYNKATDPETVISRVHTQKKQALILELTKNII